MIKLGLWKMGLEDYSIDSNLLMEMLDRSSWDGKGSSVARFFKKGHERRHSDYYRRYENFKIRQSLLKATNLAGTVKRLSLKTALQNCWILEGKLNSLPRLEVHFYPCLHLRLRLRCDVILWQWDVEKSLLFWYSLFLVLLAMFRWNGARLW